MFACNKTNTMTFAPSEDSDSQWAQWVAEDPMLHDADSEYSDQTGRMPRLLFAGRKGHFVGFVMRRFTYDQPCRIVTDDNSQSVNASTASCSHGFGFFVREIILNLIPPRDKTNKIACAPSEDLDQCDQSLRSPHDESLGPWLPIKRTAKTDQTGRMPRLI